MTQRPWQARCRHAFGVDLSGGMLRSLADLRHSGRLTLVQADVQQLPLCEGSVDAGLAMHMLYHVPDVRAAVRELRRIVRPGGTVLASTNSTGTLAAIAKVAFTSEDRVGDVIRNFNAYGFGLLYPRYKGGRPPKFTLGQRREIKKIAEAEPAEYDLPFSEAHRFA